MIIFPSTARRWTLLKSENLLRVALRNFRGYYSLCFPASQPYSYAGFTQRQSESTSVAIAAAQTLRHLDTIFILRCRPARDDELLVSQRHCRVKAHGPPSREVAGPKRNRGEQERNASEGERIGRAHADQESSQSAGQRPGGDQTG
jgi:hypothetical protein